MRFVRIACRLALLCGSAAALAACTTDNKARTSLASLLPAPMTHQRASAECWMQTEKTMQKVDLDKRVDVVNRCIDDKLSGRA
jgi:hypothetical protein